MKKTDYNLTGYVNFINKWFKDRNLHEGDGRGQLEKLREEVGELIDAYDAGDESEMRDAVGDIFVVLVGFCLQRGYTMVECVAQAYDEIKNRKGKVNEQGIFVKE